MRSMDARENLYQTSLKEFWKLNNSVHELFIFKILLLTGTLTILKNCTITYP